MNSQLPISAFDILMARSVETIYNTLIAEKESLSSLDPLAPAGESYSGLLAAITSSSKVAFWRLTFYVVAYFTHLQEVLWDAFKVEVNDLLSQAKYGSLRWYVAQALLWQFGDTLTFDDNFPVYATIDPSKRLVTHASAIEDSGQAASVFIKVAKTNAGNLVPLTSPELTAFTAYMNQIKPAGIQLDCSSLNADTFVVEMTITYNPIRLQADVQSDVEDAIKAYLKALPFDARFRRLAFEDALQAVDGVEQIDIVSMEGYQGIVATLITQEYVSAAGYMTWDQVNSSITYTS